jgi:hypothetical protein
MMRTTICAATVLALMAGGTACKPDRDLTAGTDIESERLAYAEHDAVDATIEAEVERKLGSDQETSAARIDVRATDGVVTLSGEVLEKDQSARAEDLAEDVEGVERVENHIVIASAAGAALEPARAQEPAPMGNRAVPPGDGR